MPRKLTNAEMGAFVAGMRNAIEIMEKSLALVKANARNYEDRMWEENREETSPQKTGQKRAGN